ESHYSYDNMERLSSITNGAGTTIHFGYDANGMPTSVRRGDLIWSMAYDGEGNMLSLSSPSGNTASWDRDGLGYVTSFANPLGQTSRFTWNTVNRLTSATDPLGHAVAYEYDKDGLFTAVLREPISSASFERDTLGNVTQIVDPNGQTWDFSYTSMGRLETWKDPLGNTWETRYDNRGRPSLVVYPDGGSVTQEYDASDNLVKLTHSDGTTASYSFNELNRLSQTENLVLTYDAEENIVDTLSGGVHFGATFDSGDRLASVTYNNGAFAVNYQYDEKYGLLTRISDTLTSTTVDLHYDSDLRIVGMDRSNGVNTELTLDKADQVTRIQDGAILDLQYGYDAAGRQISADMTAPLDPSEFLTAQTNTLEYDAASRIGSTGFTYDKRGRLTASPDYTLSWDGLSRLVQKDEVSFSYNGLAETISRTEAGKTTRYHYNYGINLTPIMAEQNGTDEFLRYYVWTPDGRLLYMIDATQGNAVYFYHFDRTGSTLALTDAGGSITDAYAYSPYGKLLTHQGESPQPFTFVGAYGIRQEGASGRIYQMRARYYDARLGRFLSREPLWPVIGDLRQINPYQYALNDPIQMLDMTGADSVSNNSQSPNEFAKYANELMVRVDDAYHGRVGDPVFEYAGNEGEFEDSLFLLRQWAEEIAAKQSELGDPNPNLPQNPNLAVQQAVSVHAGLGVSVVKHLGKTVQERTTGGFVSPLPKNMILLGPTESRRGSTYYGESPVIHQKRMMVEEFYWRMSEARFQDDFDANTRARALATGR
ncbi:MAG: RHS repeat-associated core domain-containing protein, partial [bacterium]